MTGPSTPAVVSQGLGLPWCPPLGMASSAQEEHPQEKGGRAEFVDRLAWQDKVVF